MSQNLQKVRPMLVSLEPGQSITFPIEKMKSVRAQASELAMIHNRKYKTRTDKEMRVIMVTRVI